MIKTLGEFREATKDLSDETLIYYKDSGFGNMAFIETLTTEEGDCTSIMLNFTEVPKYMKTAAEYLSSIGVVISQEKKKEQIND